MIKLIRSITIISLFAFFGFGALFIRYFIFPFQKTVTEKHKTIQKSWQFFIWLIKKLHMIKLEIDNLEKISNIKNSIIVSTHPSFIDIVILMSIIPNSTCFVAKKLARNPFFKGIVDLLFILEVQSIDEWLNNTCKKLDSGLNVIIFPMGLRHKKIETPKIRRGTALIAQKSQKNIVMINLETNFDFLQTNQPIYEAGNKPVIYTVEYLGEINTKEILNKYPDEVTFKTIITKEISSTLYKITN